MQRDQSIADEVGRAAIEDDPAGLSSSSKVGGVCDLFLAYFKFSVLAYLAYIYCDKQLGIHKAY